MSPPKPPPDGGGGGGTAGGGASDTSDRPRSRSNSRPVTESKDVVPPGPAANSKRDVGPPNGSPTLSVAIFASPTATPSNTDATGSPTGANQLPGSAPPATFAIGVAAPASRARNGRHHGQRRTGVHASTPDAPQSVAATPASSTQATPASPPDAGSTTVAQPSPQTASATSAASPANVWAKARETLIGGGSRTEAPVYDDEVRFAANYAIARRADYRIMPDGYQRVATPLEDETMLLYKQKKIFLTEPPRFIDEIYPLAVRLALRQAHHDHMMYDLFVQTPARLQWTAQAAKYHFFENVVRLNQATPDGSPATSRRPKSKSKLNGRPPPKSPSPSSAPPGQSKGVELFRDVFVFTVSADAHLAVLRFTRPELRTKWLNTTFKLPFGTVKLRGTSAFAQEDKRLGLDRMAIKQLYVMELLGHPNLPIQDVHAIALALSAGLPILDIKPVQPTGTRALAPHVWMIRLYSFDAPKDIHQVRCVRVKQGAREFEMGVHLPRNATRHPCATCLSVEHFHNKCPTRERNNDERAQYERTIEIPETTKVAIEPAASDVETHRQQMLRLHEAVAPGVSLAKIDEHAPSQADDTSNPPPERSVKQEVPGEDPPAPTRQRAQGKSKKGAQVRALARAIGASRESELGKQQAIAKTLKAKRASGMRPEQPAASATAEKRSKPRVKVVKRGDWSIPSSGQVIVGAKRSSHEFLSTDTRSVFAAEIDTDPTFEPVTRQPKRDGEHHTVDRSLPEPPRVRPEWHPPGGILPQATKQLTVASFLTRCGPADARCPAQPDDHAADSAAATADSVQVVGIKPGPPAMLYADLLVKIKARSVRTVADGRCLYDSLRAAQSRTCGDSVDATNPTERALTKELMADLNMLLAEDLVPLLAIGSLNLRDLCSRYLNEDTIASDAVPRLIEYSKEAAAQDGPSVDRHYWGGEAEITAFVSWTGEPVYVIDVWPDGSAYVQRYVPVNQPFPDGSTATRVVRQGPSVERFVAHVEIYRRLKVVPLMLALRHAAVDGVHTAHFSAVRIHDAEYRQFVGTKRKQDEMKQRLPRVLIEIDDLDQSLTPVAMDSEPSVWSSDACSEYVPTQDAVSEPPGSSSADPSPKAAHADDPDTSSRTARVEDVTARAMQALGDEQPLPVFDLSQLTATAPDPSISYDSIPTKDGSARVQSSLLTATDEQLLLSQLRSDTQLDDTHKRLLRKAQKANRTAYRTWQSRQHRTNPATHQLVADAVDPEQATVALVHRPGALSGLYRSLPFPEILLATLGDQTVVNIGRAAIVIGRLQMFHRLQSAVDGDIQNMLREWADAAHALKDPGARWNLVHDESRWQRLNLAASRSGLHLQHRSQPGLTNDDWGRLVAAVLLTPGAMPHAFVLRELPSRCDALLMWMSNVTNVLDTVAAGSAVARRQWSKAGEVFTRWSPTLEGPPIRTAPRSNGSGPPRN